MKGPLAIAIAICFFAFAYGFRIPQGSTIGGFPPSGGFPPRGGSFPPTSTGPYNPQMPQGPVMRFRRYADPQGSITLEGMKPLSGPDQRPSVNLDYNHRFLNNDRTHGDAYGGATWHQGGPVVPHGGVRFDHHFGRDGNGFVGGFGQVQPGHHGGVQPSFGVQGGFRFRRDLEAEDEESLEDVDSLEE